MEAEPPHVVLRTKGRPAQRLEAAVHVYKTLTLKVLFSGTLGKFFSFH